MNIQISEIPQKKQKLKSNRIYNMNVNKLYFLSMKNKIKKHLLGGGNRETYKTVLEDLGYAFNYKTKRFIKYGGRMLNESGKVHRKSGFLKDNVLFQRNYWEEINEIYDNVVDSENYDFNITFGDYPLPVSEMISLMGNRFNKLNILIEFGNKGYTLNNENRTRLVEYYMTGDESILTESDGEYVEYLDSGGSMTMNNLGEGKVNSNGAFFNYYLNKDINLKRYGIFKNKETSNYKHNCLIKALLKSKNVDRVLLTAVVDSRFIKTRNVPINKLESICKKIKCCIKVTQYFPNLENKAKSSRTTIYGREFKIIVKVGLVNNHFFIKEKTNYTMYSIKNYEEVKGERDFNLIVGKRNGNYKRDKSKLIGSYEIIKFLFKNKDEYLEEISINNKMMISPYYEDVKNKEFFSLNYDEKEIRNVKEYKETNELYDLNNHDVFISDFEAGFNPKTKHVPYLCCVRDYQKYDPNESILKPKGRAFHQSNKRKCADKLLNYVIKKSNNEKTKVLFFHNLKYDYQFLAHIYGLVPTSVIAPNNREISVTANYKGHRIIFRDTACMITTSLKNFGKMFGLKQPKEVMPYEIYTTANIKKRFIDIDEIKKSRDFEKFIVNTKDKRKRLVQKTFNGKKWNTFKDNATKWKCLKKGKVDIIQYSKIYCLIDCKVLNDGYDIFRSWIQKLTGIDILNVLTLSTVADKYVIKEGGYDDVCELSGIPRLFIQRCLIGGKTMTNQNKAHIDFRNINNRDLDINSSYPHSYCRIGGFLKGKPKIITKDMSNEELLNKDGLFVKIKIHSIKKLDFPLLSYKNKDGIRTWSNDVDALNENGVYIGKFALEDAINFANMKYEIIQGYYFDEGRNNILPTLTKHLYNERKVLKKQGNKAEAIYKLILNSIFGKTALKAFDSELIIKSNCRWVGKAENFEDVKQYYLTKKTKIFNEELYNQDLGFMTIFNGNCYRDEAKKFIRRNYNDIKEYVIRGKYFFIKKNYNVGEHFNRVHCAVDVLDMSKRTLNEVLVLCNVNKERYIKVGIIDTDSVQVAEKDVPLIEKLFKEKYKKNFFGKKLGEWDDDFKMSKSENLDDILNMNDLDKSEIKSIGAVYLTKKMYIHHLKSADGNEAYHIRMKGIPTRAIYYYCYENNCSPMEIYERLYAKEKIKFDLNCGGYMKKFKFDSIRNTVHFNEDFTREVSI